MNRLLLCAALLCSSISTTAYESDMPSSPAGDMQFQCLAITAFTEARNQGELGMALVVHTILQRAKKHKHVDLCAIAAKSYDGFRDWRPARLPWRINAAAWQLAVDTTGRTLAGAYDFASCRGATHYYNPKKAKPYWRKHMRVLCTYKDHVFMTPRISHS